MKRRRCRTFSTSDSSDSASTSFIGSRYRNKSKVPNAHEKSAEVFRKDLISAMKVSDSQYIEPDSYYIFTDTWKEEWEKGVQVPANPDTLPQPTLRIIADKVEDVLFTRPRKYIHSSNSEDSELGYVNITEQAAAVCRYDLDDMDMFWLQSLNEELEQMGCEQVDENLMEKTIEVLERQCHENMKHAIATEEGLGIEYDENVICDVCRSPDSEEGNDMVFCDKCNICVHQACYGILKVPEGSWLCRACVVGVPAQCIFCPKKGGAMKSNKTGTKWAHVSCALWIPEVSIGSPERMEPITKISHIPHSRWGLVCYLCKVKTGACIQCSVKTCITAFHVTCAFEHNLEMKTILGEDDEVRFRSFCLKHSESRQKPSDAESTLCQAPSEKTSVRAQKLQELEEEFYNLVKVSDVATELGMPTLTVDLIYNYWKLKRKSNFNKPLFPPKEEEEKGLPQPKAEDMHSRMSMFMHLRQDLERVRNLCYMITRREKLKLSQNKTQEQIFGLQVQMLNEEAAEGSPLKNALESSLFYPPPRITLKLKMPRSAPEDCRNSSAETDHGPLSPASSSPAHSLGSAPVPPESLEMRVESHPRHAVESSSHCFPSSLGLVRGESEDPSPAWTASSPEAYQGHSLGKPLVLHAALHGQSLMGNGEKHSHESEDSSPAWTAPSPEAYQGHSLGKPLVLQAALHGQSLMGNGEKHSHESEDSSPAWTAPSPEAYQGHSLGKPLVLQAALHRQSLMGNGEKHSHSTLAKANGLETSWSGDSSPKDSSSEMSCGQEAALSPHLASQGSFQKPLAEHFGQSPKESATWWVRTVDGLQSRRKPAKSASPREQARAKLLARRSVERAPDQENDGYCPDLELSDSEAEGDGNKEKVRVKREGSGREKQPRDAKRDCSGKRKKPHPFSHSSTHR
ncbi:protein Jade-3 [Pipistrellus kuhlii]|uniref:Jade family PHD finger 3 n=1 Tax=Pipistrellus kuhlii TaxID=59472 RepID=A0A7J7T1W7_PIPKU|nr:protein Jade-3 [Pipistrellus kuhlii]XP_045426383.1 protein Jade-3 [Pipistrellus kuhlii]KAF6294604.1 jade family PHD finger 3 [Pipistrellus kuhlii]